MEQPRGEKVTLPPTASFCVLQSAKIQPGVLFTILHFIKLRLIFFLLLYFFISVEVVEDLHEALHTRAAFHLQLHPQAEKAALNPTLAICPAAPGTYRCISHRIASTQHD